MTLQTFSEGLPVSRNRSLFFLHIATLCACNAPAAIDGAELDPDAPSTSRESDPLSYQPFVGTAAISAHSTPLHVEPACDDQGACCPEGTIPVLGTSGNDVFNTSTANLCHVTLGG